MIKQCGNILGRANPALTLYTSKSLTKLASKRKRARKQKSRNSRRARRACVRRRASKTTPKRRRRRRRRKAPLSAPRAPRTRPAPRSESISSRESDSESENSLKWTRKSAPRQKAAISSASNKRPCRRRARERNDGSTRQSLSKSYQESIPASMRIFVDPYQAAVENWNLDMAQTQLETQGVGGSTFPPAGADP